jgi:hypothetical protein
MGLRRTILNVVNSLNVDIKDVEIDGTEIYTSVCILFEDLGELVIPDEDLGLTVNYAHARRLIDPSVPEGTTVIFVELNHKLFLEFACNDEQLKTIHEDWGI